MAALLKLEKSSAKLTFHQSSECITSDNCDHTFCGVMFPLSVHKSLPVSTLYVTSLSVRGGLGNVSVYLSRQGPGEIDPTPDEERWEQIYNGTHQSSFHSLVPLMLQRPLELKPGERVVLYVHSTLPGDQALVYDNYCGNGPIWTDDFITVDAGLAHVSNKAFGRTSMWGWGSAWRRDRAFVGRINYGVRWALWRPQTHKTYGGKFRDCGRALFILQRRDDCLWARLPDDVIMYILNFCRWDWFDDCVEDLEKQGKHIRQRVRQGREDEISDEEYEDEYMDGGVGSATGEPRTVYTRAQARAINSARRLNSIRGHPMFAQILRESGLMGQDEADDGMVLVEGSRLVYYTQAELESSGALSQIMEDSSDEEENEGGGAMASEDRGAMEDDSGDEDFYEAEQDPSSSNSGMTQVMMDAGIEEGDSDEDDLKPAAMTTTSTSASVSASASTSASTSTSTSITTSATFSRQQSVERVEEEENMMMADEES